MPPRCFTPPKAAPWSAGDPELARRVFLIKQFGHIGEDEYLDIGINAKMSELHAAMGLCVLPKVHDIIACRKECAGWYDELLEDSFLQRPVVPEGLEHNYGFYPVVFPSHDVHDESAAVPPG